MTAHHLKLYRWSILCAELYADNVHSLEPQAVAEIVKECANRMQMDEDPWQALIDACRMADLEAKRLGKIREKVWNPTTEEWV